jgi:hypothetical protein
MSSRPRATGDRHDLVLVARGEGKLREIGDRLEAPHGITAAVIAADLSAWTYRHRSTGGRTRGSRPYPERRALPAEDHAAAMVGRQHNGGDPAGGQRLGRPGRRSGTWCAGRVQSHSGPEYG